MILLVPILLVLSALFLAFGLVLPLVRFDKPGAQRGQRGQVRLADEKLVRVGAPVVPHGDRLAAPDQLCAARPEARPAPPGEVAGFTVRRAIPALHRLHAEAVADGEAVCEAVGLRERRIRPGLQRLVEADVDAQFGLVGAEVARRPELGDAAVLGHQARSPAMMASTPRTVSAMAA